MSAEPLKMDEEANIATLLFIIRVPPMDMQPIFTSLSDAALFLQEVQGIRGRLASAGQQSAWRIDVAATFFCHSSAVKVGLRCLMA